MPKRTLWLLKISTGKWDFLQMPWFAYFGLNFQQSILHLWQYIIRCATLHWVSGRVIRMGSWRNPNHLTFGPSTGLLNYERSYMLKVKTTWNSFWCTALYISSISLLTLFLHSSSSLLSTALSLYLKHEESKVQRYKRKTK